MKPVLRVCSWNIHKGMGMNNRRFLLDDMRFAIRSVKADICFLQEVVGHRLAYGRHGGQDTASQFEFLADQVWPHFAYGRNALVDDGHHGNAILSRVPFLDWHNYDVTRWRFSSRGLLYGRTESGLHLVCVHLGLFARERRFQVQALQRLLEERCGEGEPVIVAGDFNDWRLRADRVMRRELGFEEVMAEQRGRPARSFPAALPLLRVDRIYFRNLSLVAARPLRGGAWRKLSDHAAIMASFQVPE